MEYQAFMIVLVLWLVSIGTDLKQVNHLITLRNCLPLAVYNLFLISQGKAAAEYVCELCKKHRKGTRQLCSIKDDQLHTLDSLEAATEVETALLSDHVSTSIDGKVCIVFNIENLEFGYFVGATNYILEH